MLFGPFLVQYTFFQQKNIFYKLVTIFRIRMTRKIYNTFIISFVTITDKIVDPYFKAMNSNLNYACIRIIYHTIILRESYMCVCVYISLKIINN